MWLNENIFKIPLCCVLVWIINASYQVIWPLQQFKHLITAFDLLHLKTVSCKHCLILRIQTPLILCLHSNVWLTYMKMKKVLLPMNLHTVIMKPTNKTTCVYSSITLILCRHFSHLKIIQNNKLSKNWTTKIHPDCLISPSSRIFLRNFWLWGEFPSELQSTYKQQNSSQFIIYKTTVTITLQDINEAGVIAW